MDSIAGAPGGWGVLPAACDGAAPWGSAPELEAFTWFSSPLDLELPVPQPAVEPPPLPPLQLPPLPAAAGALPVIAPAAWALLPLQMPPLQPQLGEQFVQQQQQQVAPPQPQPPQQQPGARSGGRRAASGLSSEDARRTRNRAGERQRHCMRLLLLLLCVAGAGAGRAPCCRVLTAPSLAPAATQPTCRSTSPVSREAKGAWPGDRLS